MPAAADAGDKIKGAASDAKDAVKGAAGDAKDAVSGAASDAKDAVSNLGSDAGDKLNEAVRTPPDATLTRGSFDCTALCSCATVPRAPCTCIGSLPVGSQCVVSTPV